MMHLVASIRPSVCLSRCWCVFPWLQQSSKEESFCVLNNSADQRWDDSDSGIGIGIGIGTFSRWAESESELNRLLNLMLELESESNYSQRNRNRNWNRMCRNHPISGADAVDRLQSLKKSLLSCK